MSAGRRDLRQRGRARSEEHTSELQSQSNLVCRLLLEKKKNKLSTTDPRYDKWTQWIFLQRFNTGIALRQKATVNSGPNGISVVAHEQRLTGFCGRPRV